MTNPSTSLVFVGDDTVGLSYRQDPDIEIYVRYKSKIDIEIGLIKVTVSGIEQSEATHTELRNAAEVDVIRRLTNKYPDKKCLTYSQSISWKRQRT